MPSPADLYPHSVYSSGTVYIVDDVEPNGGSVANDDISDICGEITLTEHAKKCGWVRRFFEGMTDYKVKGINLPKGSRPAAFFRYWKSELEGKGANDLIIVYYHGRAGNNGIDYSWSLDGYPRAPVNAYNLITMINRAGVDCLMLLDCDLPSRFKEKWDRLPGSIEIVANGGQLRDTFGNRIENAGDFTKAFLVSLGTLLKHIDTKRKRAISPLTIPEVMRSDRSLDFKPFCLRLDGSTNGRDNLVKRIKIDPRAMRESKKVEFFAYTIQGGEVEQGSEATIQVAIDEGIDMEGEDDSSHGLFCPQ
ncbi:uncharacterized protein LTR77_008591 [Saxophila tyrrhenica]|uniref:Uncharacterized protein n=1 Tax=Saxophila tyrrhenica TaxID=1690608 RepID=A0AAV9P533_9PEZI|nr:hypothetical protein LTR77_008591 [Saxophila tyrrhenica]